MSNVAQELVESILEKARGIAKSETLIGDPIKMDNLLVVPVVQISIGFGAGGGGATGELDAKAEKLAGTSGQGYGVGGGGGIRVEPSCFLVHDGTTVRILSARGSKAKGVDALIEKLPDLLTYAMDSLRGTPDEKPNNEEEDDAM